MSLSGTGGSISQLCGLPPGGGEGRAALLRHSHHATGTNRVQPVRVLRGYTKGKASRSLSPHFFQCGTLSLPPSQVGLLLQSCLNKVPEALSLLWAGLPHPLSHPSISLRAWHQLCLPLLHSVSNVPRQVLMFAVQYSRSLLS